MLKNTNNKGYSLVEVVVVIAITAIITTGSIIGISMLAGWKARKCCEQLVYSIREVRTEQMGRDSVSLELKKNGDSYVATKVSSVFTVEDNTLKKNIVAASDTDVPVKLGDVGTISIELVFRKKNEFSAETSSSEKVINLDDVTKVEIGFARSTGSFSPIIIDGSADYFSSDFYYLYKVSVTQGSVTREITCEQLTGQTFLK